MIKLVDTSEDELVVRYITRTFTFEKGISDTEVEETNVSADFVLPEDGEIQGNVMLEEDAETTEEDKKEFERIIKKDFTKEFGEVRTQWKRRTE